MAGKKVRQYCKVCEQVTTQTKSGKGAEWVCVCCESAKFRSQQATDEIKSKNKKKPRLNITF
jgi:hypothetical protein